MNNVSVTKNTSTFINTLLLHCTSYKYGTDCYDHNCTAY